MIVRLTYQLHTVRPGCLSTRPYQQGPFIDKTLSTQTGLSTRFDRSTRPYQYRPLIDKTLSTETGYQQGLIVGKLGQGMRFCKCNSTSNVLVCETQKERVYVWVQPLTVFVNFQILSIIIHRLSSINSWLITRWPYQHLSSASSSICNKCITQVTLMAEP